jgi:hypothetical protein
MLKALEPLTLAVEDILFSLIFFDIAVFLTHAISGTPADLKLTNQNH